MLPDFIFADTINFIDLKQKFKIAVGFHKSIILWSIKKTVTEFKGRWTGIMKSEGIWIF